MFLLLLLSCSLSSADRIVFLGRWSCNYDTNINYCPQEAYLAQSFYLGLVDGGVPTNGSLDKLDFEFMDPQYLISNISLEDMGEALPEDVGRNTKAALNLILEDNSKNPVLVLVGLSEDCNAVAALAAAYGIGLVLADCKDPIGETVIPISNMLQFDKTQGSKYRALTHFLLKNNWDHVGIINFDPTEKLLYPGLLMDALAASNIYVAFYENNEMFTRSGLFTGMEKITEFILSTYLKTRIYILMATGGDEIFFLAAMQQIGLLETGKYFVIVVNANELDDRSFTEYSTVRSQINNRYGTHLQYPAEQITLLFRHVFYLTNVPDVQIINSEEWLTYYEQKLIPSLGTPLCPPFCDRNDEEMAANDFGSGYVFTKWALAYDSGRILAETLMKSKNVNQSDPSTIIQAAKTITFKSVFGYDSKFDESGVLQKKFVVWSPYKVETKAAIFQFCNVAASLIPDGFGGYDVEMEDLQMRGVYNDGILPVAKPKCGFNNEFCPVRTGISTVEIIIIAGSSLIVLAALVFIAYLIKWIAYERRLESSYYILTRQDVHLQDLTRLASSRMGSDIYTSVLSIKSTHLQDLEQNGPAAGTMQFYQQNIRRAYRRRPRKLTKSAARRNDLWKEIVDWHLAKLDTHLVTVRKVNKDNVKLTRDMKQELDLLMTCVHENLNRFHGLIVEPSLVFTVHSFGLRKSLNDLLRNSDLRLDRMFKVSFVDDVTHGLRFLHDKCKIGYHGNLKSSNCVVDAYWRVKLSNFGLRHIRHGEPPAMADDLLWTAPELLRLDEGGLEQLSVADIASADLYSLGIILYEIYGRQGPYGDDLLDSNEILTQLKFPMLESLTRPDIQLIKKAPTPLLDVIQGCWKEDPSERPSIKKIRDKLKPLKKGLKGNIADNIMELLDRYRYNLEDVIKERTEELEDERRRNERLLLQLLPGSVADSLKNGRPVEAEFFDAVTIYFSDIVGFTALSSKSSPMQVVTMLNDLYTEFDQIIDCFDCYKVETIGDAYMYVSGLPSLNGINHAGEVASASWQLLQCIKTFTVRHCPEERLRLRIGLHTGPVVTGVVGVRMPRYCLFGDTVITASNMESSGEPMKIQLSVDTFKLLSECRGYEMQLRGDVQLKTNHSMTSYWLQSYSKEARLKRLEGDRVKYPQFEQLLKKSALID